MANPMRGGLSPLDVTTLANWLKRHPSVSIVTDTKGDDVEFLRHMSRIKGFPLKQLVPQIYYRGQLPAVRKLGFRHIIYTLYKDSSVSIPEVIAYAGRNDVSVAMPAARASEETLAAFVTAGVPVYVHTANSPAEAMQLHQWGAAGIYTDCLFHPTPK